MTYEAQAAGQELFGKIAAGLEEGSKVIAFIDGVAGGIPVTNYDPELGHGSVTIFSERGERYHVALHALCAVQVKKPTATVISDDAMRNA